MKNKICMMLVMCMVMLLSGSAHATISDWQTLAAGTAGNVVADSTGYLFDGSGGVAYDYGDLSQGDTWTAGAGVTIEYIFNLSDSGASIALGTHNGWNMVETNGLKLEQWDNTGLFGSGIEGYWDNTFAGAPSVFDTTVHAAFVYDAAGYLELYLDGVSVGTDGRAGGWISNGGIGTLGAKGDLVNDAAVGTIYGIGTYERALSAGEVAGLAAAVPEPATMLLLGLGGVLLRRKKR